MPSRQAVSIFLIALLTSADASSPSGRTSKKLFRRENKGSKTTDLDIGKGESLAQKVKRTRDRCDYYGDEDNPENDQCMHSPEGYEDDGNGCMMVKDDSVDALNEAYEEWEELCDANPDPGRKPSCLDPTDPKAYYCDGCFNAAKEFCFRDSEENCWKELDENGEVSYDWESCMQQWICNNVCTCDWYKRDHCEDGSLDLMQKSQRQAARGNRSINSRRGGESMIDEKSDLDSSLRGKCIQR